MPGFRLTGNEASSYTPAPQVETARLHRWRFEFSNILEMYDVQMYAMSIQRPSPEIDTIKMHNGQNEIHLPGKYRWNPIDVKFYETDASNHIATASAIFGYWSSTDYSQYAVVDFNTNTINPTFRTPIVKIFMYDGLEVDIHTYTLYNVWPAKVAPTELAYADSAIATVSVTLNYDSADEAAQ